MSLIITAQEMMDATIKQAQEAEQIVKSGGHIGIQTQYPRLDAAVGGMRKGSVVVLGARTGVGKSAFALNIVANNPRLHTMIISLEMGIAEIGTRLTSMLSAEPLSNFRDGTIQNWGSVMAAQEEISARLFASIAQTDVNAETITKALDDYKENYGHNVELLVIDYLQLISSNSSEKVREREVAKMSRELKKIALERNLTVLVLSQLVRPDKSNPLRKPRLTDLRESGAIEQDADVVLLMSENYDDEPTDIARSVDIEVAKNRHGRRDDMIRFTFMTDRGRFQELGSPLPVIDNIVQQMQIDDVGSDSIEDDLTETDLPF